jgi:hypothetical protein
MRKSLFFVLMFVGFLGARAGEGVALWESGNEQGGWRAFGNGMLDAKIAGDEVKLAVDWAQTSYGVGAVYEKALPDLTTMRRLVVEARASEDNGTTLAPEWAAGEKGFRVQERHQQKLKADWETYTFEIPDDFAKLNGNESIVTGLRLLFINPDKPGRADVYFRNVRLLP